jgi:hypothetical protein
MLVTMPVQAAYQERPGAPGHTKPSLELPNWS